MDEDKICKVQNQTERLHDCPAIYDYLKLTGEMIKTIICLEELVRWRQVLIKYLSLE